MANLKLEQKLELRQILTPKLIETLKLLILPKLELQSKLEQELMENPMLDATPNEPASDNSEVDSEIVLWKKFIDGMRLASRNLGMKDNDAEVIDPTTFAKYEKTLYEDLHEQLLASAHDDREFRIGEFIIGNLDDRGLLPLAIQEIKDSLSDKLEPPPSDYEVEKALKTVQSLSPPGIAARDIRECMLIQMKDLGLTDTLAYRIVEQHYDDLLRKNVPQLAKILGVEDSEVESAMEILSHLSFYPAEGRETNTSTIEPDLFVFKDNDGEWHIVYNEENLPSLSINKHYQNLLKKAEDLNEDAKKYLLQKLESARWWIDALNHRRKTLIETMRAIIENQIDFFERGPEYIKPLKMETIADIVGVHPATISRIVRNKYVLTPYGTFALRKFFTTGISSSSGEDIAADRVKNRIREIIEQENKKKPLSDEKIAQILNAEGIKIARRTVAKYREKMGILPARMRKR
ncbi:RNA polymerase sigma-54 factor [bacterium]|nr:MAG: RNA polymerase sigma-54 factor [bacterium]